MNFHRLRLKAIKISFLAFNYKRSYKYLASEYLFMKRKAFAEKAVKLSDRFIGPIPAVLTFEDPEDLHQMRVAGRSLLTCMSLVPKAEQKRSANLTLKQAIRAQMQLLGRLRDLDVLVDELERRVAVADPAYAGLLSLWMADSVRERDAARTALTNSLSTLSVSLLRSQLNSWHRRVREMRGFDPGRRIKRLRKRFKGSYVLGSGSKCPSAIDEAFLDYLHQARIRAKKLRYALTLLETGRKGELDRIKALQDRLGRVQDRRVWLTWLERYRMTYPEAVTGVSDILRAEMTDLISGEKQTE